MKILSLKTSGAGLARLAAFISSAFFILASAHAQSGTALLQHAPNLNGAVVVNGSLQQMTGESVTFNGSASISGDLFVPGTPTVTLTGHPVFGGVIVGTGSASPSNYSVILNGTPSLGHLRTRTNPTALPTVGAPPKPTGTRNVTITAAGQSIGSFSTLNNLTLNGNVGQVAIPSGTYGTFTANGAAGFTLGVAGATQPSVYNLQSLVLNGTGQLQILGPVIVTVAANVTINGGSGSLVHPEWFALNVASGALNINGNISLYAFVSAPSSSVTLNGSSQLIGGLVASQLLLNGNSLLRLQGATAPQPPVANNQSVTTAENASVVVTLAATQANNDPLTYTAGTASHGTLSGTAPNLTYTPAANYFGPDSFTFTAKDGTVVSNTATVSISVTKVNYAPVAANQSVTTAENAAIAINLTATQTNNDPLTYTNGTASHGVLSGTAPSLTYTPATNYFGPDSFTFTAKDGTVVSNTATVSITVTKVNYPPVAANQAATTAENTAIAINLTATQANNDPLTYTNGTASHGTLSGTAPALTYSPAANYFGADSFTFTAKDGTVVSNTATVSISVTKVNYPPVAANQSVTTTENVAIPINLSATQANNDALTYTNGTASHGVLSGTAPNLTYTPTTNYFGGDSFTFTAKDGTVVSNVATVTVTVTQVAKTALLEIMMPTNGQTVDHVRPMLAAHYAGTTTAGPGSFHIYVDGRDFSSEVMLEDGEVMFDPQFNFDQGSHTFRADWIAQGNIVATDSVSFTVNSTISGTRFEAEVRSTTGEPLNNVRVVAAGQQTFTDSNGKFAFDNLPDEQIVFHFDPSAVANAKTYTPVNLAFPVPAGQRTRIERPIYIAEFNAANGVLVRSGSSVDQIVTNPLMPGVRLIIPALTELAFPDGSSQGIVTLVNIPVDRSPNCLGPGFRPSRLIAIQPENTLLSKPAQLITPNDYKLPEGFPVGLKSLNIESGRFSQVGYGQITNNEMVPLAGSGLTTFDWHCMHMVPGDFGEVDTDKLKKQELTKTVCSYMSMKSGSLEEDHVTIPYSSLGESRAVTLHYSSLSAAPSISMSGAVNMMPRYLPYPVGPGGNIVVGAPPVRSISSSLSGPFGSAQTYYDPASMMANWGAAQMSAHANVATGNVPTGIYTSVARISSYLPAEDRVTYYVASSERFLQSVVYNNAELNPSFGNGWSLANVDRLLFGRGADALLATGSGNLEIFTSNGTTTRFTEANFSAELGDLEAMSTLGKVSVSDGLGVSHPVEGTHAFLLKADVSDSVVAVLRIPFNNLGYKRVAFDADVFGDLPIFISRVATASFNWSTSSTVDYSASGGFSPDQTGSTIVQGSLVLAGADTGYLRRSGWRSFYIDLPTASIGKKGYIEITLNSLRTGGFYGVPLVTSNMAMLADNFRVEGKLTGYPVLTFQPETGDPSILTFNTSTSEFVRSFPDGKQQVFDLQGRQIRISDRLGNTTSYSYTAANGDGNAFQLSSIVDPTGLVTSFTYLGGKLTQIADPAGRSTQFTYDGAGNLVRITNPDSTTRTFGYDTSGHMISQADALGQIRQYSYGVVGRLSGVTRADGATYSYAPKQTIGASGAGTGSFETPAPITPSSIRVTTVVDGNGHSESSTLDANGQPSVVTDANNNSRFVLYSSDRLPDFVSQQNGTQKSVIYDVNQQPTEVITGNPGESDSYRYDYQYGAFNLLTQVLDPLRRITQYSYDAVGNLTQLTDANGGIVTMTYNARGQLLTSTDQRGGTTRYNYDGYGRKTSVSDALNRTTTFSYDNAGNLLSVSDPLGRLTSYQYDLGDKVTQVTAPDGGATFYQYDGNKNLIKTTDPLGHVSTWAYDARQRISSMTNALGQITRMNYDAVDNLIKMTDSAGKDWLFSYDGLNRKISATDPKGQVTRWEYDGIGLLTKTISPDGSFKTNTYDRVNRMAQTAAQDGSITQFAYDKGSQLIKVVDPLNGVLQHGYDQLGRRISTTDQLGRVSQTDYDSTNNVVKLTRPDGTASSYGYDAANQRINLTAADGGGTTYSYDAVGNLVSLIDAAGHTRQFGYDALNRPASETDALGRPRQKIYDLAGNLTALTRRDGVVINYTYDALNRLTGKILPAIAGLPTDAVTMGYDVLGNVISASNNVTTIANTYDADSLLTQTNETFSGNTQSFYYAYDVLNRRVQMTDALGVTNYGYDSRDRLVQLTDTGRRSYGFSYDALSRQVGSILPNGVTTTSTYDAASQLLSLTHQKGAAVLSLVDYTYNTVGNRIGEDREDGITRGFAYDPVDRVISTASSMPLAVPSEAFNYDFEGNWTIGSRVHDATNQLTSDATYSYAYDAEGNLVTKTNRFVPTDVTSYAYDAQNRLVKLVVGLPATSTTTYQYDALDRRIAKTVNGMTTRYVLDGNNPRLEMDGASNVVAANQYAGLDRLLARDTGLGSYFVHQDGLGSTVAITDSSGNVVERYRYSSFGQISVLAPDYSLRSTSPKVPYTFAGRDWEPEVGLYFYRARYYSPTMGRFISQDPFGLRAGKNYYAYVGNNPFNLVDPYGLFMGTPLSAGEWLGSALSGAGEGAFYAGKGLVTAPYRLGQGVVSGYQQIGGLIGDAIVDPEQMNRDLMNMQLHPVDTMQSGAQVGWDMGKGMVRGVECKMQSSEGRGELWGDLAFATLLGKVGAPAEEGEGVVYKRINPETGEEYVGQAKSAERFEARQAEHDRDLGVEHDYEILGRANPGTDLDVLEERMIRDHGGLQREGGTLANKRHQMSDARYELHQ